MCKYKYLPRSNLYNILQYVIRFYIITSKHEWLLAHWTYNYNTVQHNYDLTRMNGLNLIFFRGPCTQRNHTTNVGISMPSSPVTKLVLWTDSWLSNLCPSDSCFCLRCIDGLCSCPKRGNEIIFVARSDINTFCIFNDDVASSAPSWEYPYIMCWYSRMLASEMSLLIPYVSAGRRTLVLSITLHHKGLWKWKVFLPNFRKCWGAW